MVPRKSLAAMLVLLLAFPAWGEPSVVGNIASSQAATVRGTSVTPGSTIFSGDTIEVGARGSARIALADGAQLQLAQNSQVRLTKTPEVIQVAVERGGISFRAAEKSPFEARLADATIRAADGLPAVGLIVVRSPQSAVVAAEKGTLLVNTARDSKSFLIREGEGAEVTLAADDSKDQQNEKRKKDKGAVVLPAGSWTFGKVAVFAAVMGGLATAIGVLLGQSETKRSPADKCNEISPFRCL